MTSAETKAALMKAARIQEGFRMELETLPEPEMFPGGALVRVSGCGLCGSDLDKLINRKANPGSILGHEVVGIIEVLDAPGETAFETGDRIVTSHHVPCGTCHYCLNDSESMCREFKASNIVPGGFAEKIALTRGHLEKTVFKVPDDIGDEEASCVEPLACVLRGIRRAGHFVDGSVGVIGLGFIGMMAAQIYKNIGFTVFGVDLDSSRLAMAIEKNYLHSGFHPSETAKLSEIQGLDAVFLTVVNQATLNRALSMVRDGGTIVVFTSATGEMGFGLDPSTLYFREISVVTSYSPALEDLRTAARIIFNREIDVQSLITHRLPVEKISEAVELYQNGDAIKVYVTL